MTAFRTFGSFLIVMTIAMVLSMVYLNNQSWESVTPDITITESLVKVNPEASEQLAKLLTHHSSLAEGQTAKLLKSSMDHFKTNSEFPYSEIALEYEESLNDLYSVRHSDEIKTLTVIKELYELDKSLINAYKNPSANTFQALAQFNYVYNLVQ